MTKTQFRSSYITLILFDGNETAVCAKKIGFKTLSMGRNGIGGGGQTDTSRSILGIILGIWSSVLATDS